VLFANYLLNPGDCDAICPLAGRVITDNDQVIRFMNMQLFLLSSIDEYGSKKSLNINSVNELTIPGTDEPMLPSSSDKSKLAQEIRTKLSQFKWFIEKSSSVNEPPFSRTPVIPTPMTPVFISPRKSTMSDYVIDIEETHSDDPQGKNRQKKKFSEMVTTATNYLKLNTNSIILLGLLCAILILVYMFFSFNLPNTENMEPQDTLIDQAHRE